MRPAADLERRQREILAAVVRQYVSTGAPVGSKLLVERLGESLSSATIRSVMAQLESAGYLAQPHVSAGRIPTDKAYRFYVDRIVGSTPLGVAVERRILESLGVRRQSEDRPYLAGLADEISHTDEQCQADTDQLLARLMVKTSQLLAELSENIGLALGPSGEERILEHVKFVKLPDSRVLAVVVSKPDLIENKVVRPGENFSQEELDDAASYLNAEFRGWSLLAIRLEIFKKMEEVQAVQAMYHRLVARVAMLFASGALSLSETAPLFVEGTSRMLARPEFEDARNVRAILDTLQQKAKLVHILNTCLRSPHPGVRIVIGSENAAVEMRQCTLILAPFHYGRQMMGALGVVGPTRMEYDRAVRAVEYVAQLCSKLLSGN
jgi:heat-inducible transcriptional repressor